ncbi:MAG: hypothetical protein KAH20_14480 [Methylococcales bacterium]|nr:hypothetical protein [Methylococcales bacterium]
MRANTKKIFCPVHILALFFLLVTSNTIFANSNCAYKSWVDLKWYNSGDKVEYKGEIYVAKHSNPGYEPTISTWFWHWHSTQDASCSNRSTVQTNISHGDGAGSCGTEWHSANLTYYSSYPDENESECSSYENCPWMGQFSGLPDKKSKSWVKQNNIIAVHSRDFERLNGKTLNIRQGSKVIKATVYDECSDADCDGCCSANLGSENFLIDIEKYTMRRFGSYYGSVEWQICD